MALDIENYWVNQTVFLLPTNSLFLLAILNSRLAWWFMSRTLPHKIGEALSVQKEGLLDIPVPEADNSLKQAIEQLVRQACALAGQPEQRRELLEIELQLNERVMEAYGLTRAEVELVNATLPLRDPLAVLNCRI